MIRRAESTAYAEACEVIGRDAAAALQNALGGHRVYVPRQPGAAHPLSAAIGQVLAQKLADRCAGDTLDIPLSPKRRSRIVALKEAGRTVNEIISELKVSRRTVFYALADQAGSGVDPDQLPLL